jgi:glycerol-3-phosphate dehydrogenase (NAD+)
MERLKKLRGEEDADATPATPATAAASATTGEEDEQTASPDESSEPKVVAVLGSGKFGTAMAVVMARNGHTVRILTRRPEIATSINESHKHPICFVDTALSPKISATTDAATALAGVDYIVHAVPVQASAKFLSSVAQFVPPTAPVVSLSKGIDVVTLGMMVDVIKASLGPDQPCCCLSGPSFASELVDSQPTGMVLACSNLDVARHAATLFHSKTLRVYLSEDVVGVEICGALKNVYAIAAGAAEGMGLGLNSAALLVTRANKEMARVCIAKGAQVKTVSGLSGVGDLMLTCFGKVSRNRTVGKRMGQGETVAQILATSTEVAEGITTTPAAARLARALSVKAPIIFAMEQVVSGVVSPKEALLNLMSRPMSVEDDS